MAIKTRRMACSWLASELRSLTHIVPFNVMDIKELAIRARLSERKLRDLSDIADELGWHVDASPEIAYALIKEYERKYDAR